MTNYDSTEDFSGVMVRAEEGQRRGEAVVSLSKRWRYGGLSILARGGVICIVYGQLSNADSSSAIAIPFAYTTPDISAVATITPKPINGENHDEQTMHRGVVTRIGPTTGIKSLYLPHPKTGRHAKIYRLVQNLKGPERVRRVLEQEYEVPMKLRVDMPCLRKSITRSSTDENAFGDGKLFYG